MTSFVSARFLVWSILACGVISNPTKRSVVSVAFAIRNNANASLFARKTWLRQPHQLSSRSSSSSNNNNSNMWMKKFHCPPAERNKEFIWNVLKEQVLPQIQSGSETLQILEVAAGSGVHTAYLASQLATAGQKFQWQSSDPELESRESQKAYIQEDFLQQLQPEAGVTAAAQTYVSPEPLCLTLSSNGIIEPETESLIHPSSFDLIINVNMIHISPWSATEGLMKLASQKLKAGGMLYLYGPYLVNGTAVASNLKFDEFLKLKDPGFGLRNLEEVTALAEQQGLEFLGTVSMPANNLSVIFRLKQQQHTKN